MTGILSLLANADAASLADAAGLPAGTTVEDLREAGLVVDDAATGDGHLGDDSVRATWVSIESDVYEGGLLAWLRDDVVIMLEGSYPIDADGEPAVAEVLREPERRLDTCLGRVLLEAAESVYPGQGLTVRVNPDNSMLLSVYSYTPTSADRYEQLLRPDPERGGRR